MQYATPAGFYAFTAAIALIIIYLIRPKPKEINIPSLMFFMKETDKSVKKSFFERLLRSLVLLLQLLAVVGLAFALTTPSMNVGYDTTAENTVIVLDLSASTQANSNARFNKEIKAAKDALRGDVSIVVAHITPLVLLTRDTKTKAEAILNAISPRDTGTNLGDAMLLAKDLLNDEEGRILVLSDFIITSGPEPDVVKKVLESAGAVVDFVNVGDEGENVGITDMLLERHNVKIFVKNFADNEKTVTVSMIGESKELKAVSKTILSRSIETFDYEVPPGLSMVQIKDSDALTADNTAYIAAPEQAQINVLIITSKLNAYLDNALKASKDITFKVAEPPIIPEIKDYDVIILSDFDKSKILSGTIEEISREVERSGKSLIIMAQNSLPEIDLKGMLPVELGQKVTGQSATLYGFSESESSFDDFTDEKSIDYGSTTEYFTTTAKNGSVVYAQTEDDIPMIVSIKKGGGNTVYYGLFDDKSTFKSSPSYPLFWNNLINAMMGTEDINNFNYRTGKMITFSEPTQVKTPDGTYSTQRLIMDRSGFYEFGNRKYAVNLLDEKESDISKKVSFETTKSERYIAKEIERRKDVSLAGYVAAAALLFMLLELAYVKYSGEL